ncbi:MAG: hypothetical protein HYT08_04285 [Candidatus Levybacteria bacterium]|nr:hypothetical protein [Candidatus Levybacteria bacterium]
MIDAIEQPQPNPKLVPAPELRERYMAADKGYFSLADEIGSLSDDDITDYTAPFIAGLLLSRRIEFNYLYNHVIEDLISEEHVDEKSLKWAKDHRVYVGEIHQILIDAKRGDFTSLKQFIKEESDVFSDMEADEEEKQLEEKWKRNSEKLALVAERLPNGGDGSTVKAPSPAWMEEPTPLRIQLQMLKEGQAK